MVLSAIGRREPDPKSISSKQPLDVGSETKVRNSNPSMIKSKIQRKRSPGRKMKRSKSCDELTFCRSRSRTLSPVWIDSTTGKIRPRFRSEDAVKASSKAAKMVRQRSFGSASKVYSSYNSEEINKVVVTKQSEKRKCISAAPEKRKSSSTTENRKSPASRTYVNRRGGSVAERSNKTSKSRRHTKTLSLPSNSLLHYAVIEGDLELVERLLKADVSIINNRSLEGTAPVHEASLNGDTECLELLLQYGANVELLDSQGHTPLEYAVYAGQFDCAQFLLNAGANVDTIRDGLMTKK